MSATARIRQLLMEKPLVVAMGAWDAVSAKLVSQAGFDAVYVGGHAVAATYGHPDIGLTTLTEVVQRAQTIAEAVEEPVVIDADTGYGGIFNARRAIRSCERAGVAGFHIEDQVFPKKCGSYRGVSLISKEEMVAKLKATVDARSDPNFLVIARTDALSEEGLELTIERAKAYEEAGADAIMVMGARGFTFGEMKKFTAALSSPCVWIWSETEQWVRRQKILSFNEIKDAGFKMCISPLALLYTAAKAVRDILAEIKKTGTSAHLLDRMLNFEEFTSLMGLPEIYKLESKYCKL
jgi:2-methylisocitrate lyase-like PEP mutase family enzyme